MQDSSGITAISVGVSEITVGALLVFLAAALLFWIVRRVRQKKVPKKAGPSL
jgi:hypothetical protein